MSDDARPPLLGSSQRTASQRLNISLRLSSRGEVSSLFQSQRSVNTDPLSSVDAGSDPTARTTGPAGLTGPQLMEIFPFHIGIDRDFNGVQYGNRLELVIPQIEIHTPIARYLRLAFPKCGWTWKDLDPCKDASFEIDVYVDGDLSEGGEGGAAAGSGTGTGTEGGTERAVASYRLAGGLYLLQEKAQGQGYGQGQGHGQGLGRVYSDDMLAVSARASAHAPTAPSSSVSASHGGSLYAVLLVEPNLQSIAALVTHGLTWSDFPRHSSQQRLIILAEQLRSEQNKQTKAKADERDSRKKEFVDTVFSLELLVANDFSVWFYIIQLTDIDGVEQR